MGRIGRKSTPADSARPALVGAAAHAARHAKTRSYDVDSHLPDQDSIGVVDRNTGGVTKWKIPGHTNVHALALDEANHRLFAASLQPGRLTVVDTQSGQVVAALPCILGVDDIWFDPARKRIYAPGAGAIDVFHQVDPDRYTAVARIQVGAGAGSTSFRLKTRTQDSLFMSWPNMLPQGGSEVLLFYVND